MIERCRFGSFIPGYHLVTLKKGTIMEIFIRFFSTLLLLRAEPDHHHGGRSASSDRLLDYLAVSQNPNFKRDLCIQELEKRQGTDTSHYNFNTYETNQFTARLKFIAENNRGFELAMKRNPSVEDVEAFSCLKPCFSILKPVKDFLADHPDLARSYRGMQPFGQPLEKFLQVLAGEAGGFSVPMKGVTFSDHVRLRDITNYLSDMTGMTTMAVNTLMYDIGRSMP